MDLELRGKHALVTGGSRGIGLAIARQLALEGASVALAARDSAVAGSAARELAAHTGSRVIALSVDTGVDAQVKAMVAAAVTGLGGVDILVNCAAKPGGMQAPPSLAGIDDALFWEHMNVKVMGYLRCAREVAPHMIARGWGRIINISGSAARNAGAGTGGIIGSMRNVAVSAMTKNLADELGPHGINVTVVHPGITRTERTAPLFAARAAAAGVPLEQIEARAADNVTIGRLVNADEVAYVVAFLASPRSVAITGDAIAAGGGTKGAIHY
jgi:NAD(P)-dependent dehydrogenase (short-subunit alcohol dehydrogenase family)